MPPRSPLQFAIVREDPCAELALLPPRGARTSALLVASGGCSALAIATARPDVELVLLDLNPAQLEHTRRKWSALAEHGPASPERASLFGVHRDDPDSLSGRGNFEALFRGLRAVLDDLVLGADDRRALLADAPGAPPLAALLESKWWPVAFELFFSDRYLETMFGPDATQHAVRGSYPGYFRGVIERGLVRADRARNGWLHQVLLGHWLEASIPAHLRAPAPAPLRAEQLVCAAMIDAPRFDRFDLVSLSNLFDWMDAAGVEAIARRLEAECRPGTVLLVRQLNNRAPIERLLPSFAVDAQRSAALEAADQSLFYERFVVLVKRGAQPRREP